MAAEVEVLEPRILLSSEGLGLEAARYLAIADPHGGADGYGAVLWYDTVAETSTVVSDNALHGFRRFVHPTAVVTERINGTEYLTVVDPFGGADGHGAVLRIDPATGTAQVLSDNHLHGWRRFVRPTGLVLETINGTQYLTVVDSQGGGTAGAPSSASIRGMERLSSSRTTSFTDGRAFDSPPE